MRHYHAIDGGVVPPRMSTLSAQLSPCLRSQLDGISSTSPGIMRGHSCHASANEGSQHLTESETDMRPISPAILIASAAGSALAFVALARAVKRRELKETDVAARDQVQANRTVQVTSGPHRLVFGQRTRARTDCCRRVPVSLAQRRWRRVLPASGRVHSHGGHVRDVRTAHRLAGSAAGPSQTARSELPKWTRSRDQRPGADERLHPCARTARTGRAGSRGGRGHLHRDDCQPHLSGPALAERCRGRMAAGDCDSGHIVRRTRPTRRIDLPRPMTQALSAAITIIIPATTLTFAATRSIVVNGPRPAMFHNSARPIIPQKNIEGRVQFTQPLVPVRIRGATPLEAEPRQRDGRRGFDGHSTAARPDQTARQE